MSPLGQTRSFCKVSGMSAFPLFRPNVGFGPSADSWHCSKMVLLGIWTHAAISIAAYAFFCGVAPSSFASLSIKLDAPVTSMPLGVLVTTRRNPKPRKVKEWPICE
jgi:hypothetical protein